MKKYSRVMAKIDLDAIAYNMEQMHQNIQENTRIIAVVKTDGYGHGALPIARMLEAYDYVWGYATATLDEAVLLRKGGIQKPILVLGCIFPDQFEEMLQNDIRMTVYQEENMREVSELAGKLKKQAFIHIKLDTGMARLGFAPDEENAEIIKRIAELPNISAEGVFTHFARADETDKEFTRQQMQKFRNMTERLGEMGVEIPFCHCSNSAGIIDIREANCDLARAGIAIYGLYPSEEVSREAVGLRPALSLFSHVEYVKTIPAGTAVSYGGTYVAEKEMRIATIPVGYGDGYPRSLSNKAYVLIHGQKAPILGRVCMDQFMVDVSAIENVRFGDEVVLIGTDGEETITVEMLSTLADRFNYEFLCCLGKRIPRVYYKNGVMTEQIDYFA